MLDRSLAQTPVDAIIKKLMGDYNSPTLLINSFDVTRHPRAPKGYGLAKSVLILRDILLVLVD
jgi:hypothetical protein